MNAKDGNGDGIVSGRSVTGFSNIEEDAVGLTAAVPLLVEDTLIDRGAHCEEAEDFAHFVRRDGQLTTGQIPASSVPAAALVLNALN